LKRKQIQEKTKLHLPSETRPRTKRKTTRHKKRERKISQDVLERVLESRVDPIDQQIWSNIPTWLSPGASLCNSIVCSRWEQDNECSLTSKCRNCGRTILYHSLSLSLSITRKRNGTEKVLEAFALVRDIRCCSSSLMNELYGSDGENRSRNVNLEDYIDTALSKSNVLVGMDFSRILVLGEADLLMGKFNEVKNASTLLRGKIRFWTHGKRKKSGKFKLRGVFDEIVRLMICCDSVYFRMYYLQNSGNLPIENEDAFLPHPTTYFGSKNVAWVVCDHITDHAKALRKKFTEISDSRWDDLMEELGIKRPFQKLDALSFMHKNRLSESIFIFHRTSWIDSEETKDSFMESIEQKAKSRTREHLFYATHETPAPIILREWRDSCRDLLCSLYAYATISPGIIHDMKKILYEEDILCKRVMEMGAGTGYIASLLHNAGLRVSAFDVAPTKPEDARYRDSTEPNEYHGASPPFYPVENVSANNLKSALGHGLARGIALLLCYPPPLSDMAEASLKSFMMQGGETIIHIGEFSGLTGSSKFENILSTQFVLKHRTRCLNWGSDAAELTVWTKAEEHQKLRPKTLVQCSGCKNINALWRFRICRPLSYCKSSCFDEHKDERGVYCAFNMIPNIMNKNDFTSLSRFEKEKYFESLPCRYKV